MGAKDRKPKEYFIERISVRLPKELHHRIDAVLLTYERKSALIRTAVRREVERRELQRGKVEISRNAGNEDTPENAVGQGKDS